MKINSTTATAFQQSFLQRTQAYTILRKKHYTYRHCECKQTQNQHLWKGWVSKFSKPYVTFMHTV